MINLLKHIIGFITGKHNDITVYTEKEDIIKEIIDPKNKLSKIDLCSVPEPEYLSKKEDGPTILFVDDQPTSATLFSIVLKNIKRMYGLDILGECTVAVAIGPRAGSIAYKYIESGHKIDVGVFDITLGEMIRLENNDLVEIDGIDLGITLFNTNKEASIRYLSAHSLNKNNPLLNYYYTKYEKLTGMSIENHFLNKGDEDKATKLFNIFKQAIDGYATN